MFINNTEELAQNKLLLLYIIDISTYPLTNEELTDFILRKDYMNYFVVQQYLVELLDSNFIKQEKLEKKKVYTILDKGKITLSFFENRLPLSRRKEISAEFCESEEEAKRAAEIVCDYYKQDNNQYLVLLKLIENSETLFSVRLSVPTVKEAEKISKIWKSKPDFIYTSILNLLLDEDFQSAKD